MSSLSTVRLTTQHFKLLDFVDQELPKATGQHGLCFLVAPVTSVEDQDLALERLYFQGSLLWFVTREVSLNM